MREGLDCEHSFSHQNSIDWFQYCSLDLEGWHIAALEAALEAWIPDVLQWWNNHPAMNSLLAWMLRASLLLLHTAAVDLLLDTENLQQEDQHRHESLDLLPIDSQVPCSLALHVCTRPCTNRAVHLRHWPEPWGIEAVRWICQTIAKRVAIWVCDRKSLVIGNGRFCHLRMAQSKMRSRLWSHKLWSRDRVSFVEGFCLGTDWHSQVYRLLWMSE